MLRLSLLRQIKYNDSSYMMNLSGEGCLQMSKDHETLSSQVLFRYTGSWTSTPAEHSLQGRPRYGMRTGTKRMTTPRWFLLVGLLPSLFKAVTVLGLHDGQSGAEGKAFTSLCDDVLIRDSGAMP